MKRILFVVVLVAVLAGGLYAAGYLPDSSATSTAGPVAKEPVAPAVTVFKALPVDFQQVIQVTGTLVPREEILIAPEIEGHRLVEVLTDEGATVTRGQVLARLETATLEAQLAQNDANIARANAALAQTESQIVQAEARVEEARNALTRAGPLRQQGFLAESTFEQREANAKTAEALLVSARDGLRVAQAEKELAEAQRRELTWRRSRSDIKSPVDGIVSRRTARVGALASSAGDPLFRIIAGGEVELDAEIPESQLASIRTAQAATIAIAGLGEVGGRVRLVSPEIDRSTRLGRVRVLLEGLDRPRVGSFARGNIVVATGRGLAVPASAVLYHPDGPRVLVVQDDKVTVRPVVTGLSAGGRLEITRGLAEGDIVVAKSGTFLREGDRVRPILEQATRVSEAK